MRFLLRGITLLYFAILLLTVPSIRVTAETKKPPVSQDQVARKKIAELEIQLKAQSDELNSLKIQINENQKQQETHAQKLDQSAQDQDEEIKGLKKQNAYNSELSSEGAVILLIGLLVEILGALLLGAPVLATKIEELSDFEIDPLIDLATHSPKKEAVLAFYSMIGNVLLFLGFTAQFAGTALVLSVDWRAQLVIVLSGLAIGFGVLIWLLGIDPKQTRIQKIVIVWKNIIRVAKLKTSSLFLRGRQCGFCLKKVKNGESFIFWYQQANSSSHPYLYAPSQFLVGHESCMNKKVQEKIEAQANFENRDKIKPHLHVLKGQDFVANRVDNYKKWFAGYQESRSKVRADWQEQPKQEIEMDAAVTKIKRIDS